MGWTIRFIKDYDGYKAGQVFELPDEGLCIYYCGIRKVAERIYDSSKKQITSNLCIGAPTGALFYVNLFKNHPFLSDIRKEYKLREEK